MFKGLVIVFLVFLVIFTPIGRFIPLHLPQILLYVPKDIYEYYRYKKYNECPYYGAIDIYNGYFGSGKSVSAVSKAVDKIYRRYNGLDIWSKEQHCFIKQKITIISNIALVGVPYVPFVSEQQIFKYEAEEGEVLIFLIDEIGTVWNNRAFKNFSPDVFNAIVQSRKRKIYIIGTIPKIIGTDINVRRFTNDVIVCSKWWRIIKHRYFKADELENCSNVDMLEPYYIKYQFVTNRMYNQYDTNEIVDKLQKDMEEGKLLSFRELANQSDGNGDIKQARLKKRFRKRQTS